MKGNPYLKVKLKTLAAESRIIRKDEIKCSKLARKAWTAEEPNLTRRNKMLATGNGLYRHRIDVVRLEARLTLLAMQCARGVPYEACEKPRYENRLRKSKGHHEKIQRMINKHCDPSGSINVEDWIVGKRVSLKNILEAEKSAA